MKKVFILFTALILCLNVTAQSNFYKISLGAGIGITQSFTDVQKHDYGLAAYGTLDYFFTPFLSLGGELQSGQINGGSVNNDPYERQFINGYKAFTINGKLYLGTFINYGRSGFANAVKWLYVGSGIGVINNKMTSIARYQASTGYLFPGKDNSNDLLIPLNIGISYYFRDFEGRPRFGLNANYQANLTIGEGLDGYDDSSVKFENSNPDVYTYFSVGIKYNFGTLGLSRKSLY